VLAENGAVGQVFDGLFTAVDVGDLDGCARLLKRRSQDNGIGQIVFDQENVDQNF
jgi:hypothetical protein